MNGNIIDPNNITSGLEKRIQTKGKDWIVFHTQDMDKVKILRTSFKVVSTDESTRNVEIYYPPNFTFNQPLPLVIIFAVKKSSMHKASYVSWAQLIASNGMSVLTYEADNPLLDYIELQKYILKNSTNLFFDTNRIGLLAFCVTLNRFSELRIKNEENYYIKPKCGLFFSGRLFHPKNYTPKYRIIIVNSGMDYQVCKISYRIFIEQAQKYNIDYKLIEYPEGVHRFDIKQDTEKTKTIIKKMVRNLKLCLLEN